MSLDVHIIITGICALLTAGGMPRDVVLPANPSTITEAADKHVAWVLFRKGELADPAHAMFERASNDTADQFRFVRLDNESVSFEPAPFDKSTAIIDGIPLDPVNPLRDRTTMSMMHWVADMQAVVPSNRLRIKDEVDLAADMHISGGTFSTNLVVRNCIWEFQPAPARPYKQAFAEEVDWNFSVGGDRLVVVLTKFDGSGSRRIAVAPTTTNALYVVLGNTPEADIVPRDNLECDPAETMDHHWDIFYELFEPLTARPIPHKAAESLGEGLRFERISAFEAPDAAELMLAATSADGAVAPKAVTQAATVRRVHPVPLRRGSGHNCAPARLEKPAPIRKK